VHLYFLADWQLQGLCYTYTFSELL